MKFDGSGIAWRRRRGEGEGGFSENGIELVCRCEGVEWKWVEDKTDMVYDSYRGAMVVGWR